MIQVGETKREKPEHICWGAFDQEIAIVLRGSGAYFRKLAKKMKERVEADGGDDPEAEDRIKAFTPLAAAQFWYVADQWPKDVRESEGMHPEWNVAAALAPFANRVELLRQWSALPEPRPCVEDFLDTCVLVTRNGQHR